MRKRNEYIAPRVKPGKAKKYVCAGCGKELTPEDACFYVDGCNIAITRNSPPYCRSCYEAKYGALEEVW